MFWSRAASNINVTLKILNVTAQLIRVPPVPSAARARRISLKLATPQCGFSEVRIFRPFSAFHLPTLSQKIIIGWSQACFLTQICAGRESRSTFSKVCSKFSHGEWSSQEKACGCHRIGLWCLPPGINSLGCPLEVLPVQGRGRRVYQLSLGCQTTHYGI